MSISIESSLTTLSLLPPPPALSQYDVGNPESSLMQYEIANQESDARLVKPNITMPTTPLAVWVIRRIGLATVVAKTKAVLDATRKSNPKPNVNEGLNDRTVAAVAWWIKGTVQMVVADALKDIESGMDKAKADAMGQRVAEIVAGLLAPHFF